MVFEDGGLLDDATSGLEARIEDLSERYTRTEKIIDATISRYRSQFSQLDGMIASMRSAVTFPDQRLSETRFMMNLSQAPIETPQQVVDYYQALLQRSARMLHAAREGDWSRLLDEQTYYVVEVERLSHYEPELELDEGCRDIKSALVERILEQDAEIRRLLETKRDALGELIGSSQRKRNLGKAYRGGTTVVDASERFVAQYVR